MSGEDLKKRVVKKFMQDSFTGLRQLKKEKRFQMPKGNYQISAVISGNVAKQHSADQSLFDLLIRSYPMNIGISFWKSISGIPKYLNGHIEDYSVSENTLIRYWHIQPEGKFYQYGRLDEDKNEHPELIDVAIRVLRVAQTLKILLEFAKAMSFDKNSTITVLYKWNNLKGRRLGSINNSSDDIDYMDNSSKAKVDNCEFQIVVPINTANSEIASFTFTVVHALFEKFDFDLPLDKVKKIVSNYL